MSLTNNKLKEREKTLCRAEYKGYAIIILFIYTTYIIYIY